MLIAPDSLLDGCVRTLLEAVLPDVGSRFARGQVYAVVDVLRNLQGRLEEKADVLEAEASSAAGALERAVAALRTTRSGDASRLADRVAARAAEGQAGPPAARAAALRAAVGEALAALHALPDDDAAAARAALGAHVAAQAVRDVMLLKPSLLAEISKG